MSAVVVIQVFEMNFCQRVADFRTHEEDVFIVITEANRSVLCYVPSKDEVGA